MPESRQHTVIKKQVLSLLRNHGNKAFRPKEISKTLGFKDNNRYKVFREVLAELERTNQVDRIGGGQFQHRQKQRKHVVEGMLTVNPRGFGFLRTDDERDDVYIPKYALKTALDGDRVRIELAAPNRGGDKKGQREGEVLDILERTRTQTVGTFDKMGHFALVKPDDQKLTHDIYVPREDFNGATEGDKVVVSIDSFDDPKASPEGRVLQVLGRADDPGVSVLALAMAQGIRSDFPPEVEEEAARIAVEIPKDEIARRLDLRNERVFTIDPVDAKDFDDAIHIKRLDSGDFEVGVHIADVSHYVKVGTDLDEEAFARGTSTYLVDRVIPMLPEVLSNEVCSLRPNEDKLTYSCLMTVTPQGEARKYRIAETVIHSQARLAYEDAQEIIDGGGLDNPMKDDVLMAASLARAITKKRMKEGSIDFDVPEARVVLDDQGRPTDIVLCERQEANRLIEEFMLLANKSVAMEVGLRLKKPFVYRIHASPDSEKIRNLSQYVSAFGYKLPMSDDSVSSTALNDLLKHVNSSDVESDLLAREHWPFRPRLSALHTLHKPHPPVPRPGSAPASQTLPRRWESCGKRRTSHPMQTLLGPRTSRCGSRARERATQESGVRRAAPWRRIRRRGGRRNQIRRVRADEGTAGRRPRARARHGQRLLGVRRAQLRPRGLEHEQNHPSRRCGARPDCSGQRGDAED